MEVRLLVYLADRIGEIVSQAELLREVWQYAPEVRTTTLLSTVHRLRRRAGAGSADPRHLLTARRGGWAGRGGRTDDRGAEHPRPTSR